MNHSLPPDIEQLIARYKPEKVILFGSRAKGTGDPGSDFDFLVIKTTSTRRILRREEALAGVDRQVPLDLIILTPEEVALLQQTGSTFLQEILESGEIVYEAG